MQSFRLSFSTYLSTEDIRIGKGYNVKRRFRKRYICIPKKEIKKILYHSKNYIFFPWIAKGNLFSKKKTENKKSHQILLSCKIF